MPPVFAHGALRLYLLALLEGGPKHGYELIKALKDRFGGAYSPSAGTIYPRLGKLEADGLVATEPSGRRTTYLLTAAGLAELNRRRVDLAAVEKGIATSMQRLALELMLQQFRDGIRADLQGQAPRRPLNPVALENVRTVLEQARVAISNTLQH
ncbi:PadR family transcriptional regulator [Arthrobacter sp. SLBN-112]|jgi:DNA-binding PadR family transcriptional regulator|uniref:PadR family transcriptional regulator n=1 Tax=Arthrobacter sp. SLBN-112 TaxID=2768452 RepID=UPI0027B4C762|nr:PadR family transcriptional regulator [Arthrobacter sp. SLBN-112]MDQ0800678.1 DNA-binding PadR family transcriptional regulator [Arthrobacter sp. SLBN-112]